MTRYAVTGATGWLGRAAVEVLRRRGEQVLPFASRRHSGCHDLSELPNEPHDVLLHFAFVTREKLAEVGHSEYVAANVAITTTVLEAVAKHQPAMFYASSGAVEAGGTLEANPYGVLKRLDEHAFRDASGGRCAVARIFNVAGPHVQKAQTFLLTSLLSQALAGKPLQVRSSRRVVRSYVDVEEVAAWAIAHAGRDVAISTGGDEVVEAGELAERVASAISPGSTIDRPAFDPALPPDIYVGNGRAWRDSCDAAGITAISLERQVLRTAAALRGPRDDAANSRS